MCKDSYSNPKEDITSYESISRNPTLLESEVTTSDDNIAPEDSSKTTLLQVFLWSLLTFLSKEFSLFLPIFQSSAGAKTFIHAGYQYDEDLSVFDNTIWTWGTDYAMALLFTFAAIRCLRAIRLPKTADTLLLSKESNPKSSKSLRIRSMLLLTSYAISVLFGGYAHYTFKTIDELNSVPFRICWIICVGSVSSAGGFMGSCGSEICLAMNRNQSEDKVRFRMPYVSDLLWFIYGGFMTYICIVGDMSYQRPACDIFVAGTSQFVPTVYCILTVLSVKWTDAKVILETPVEKNVASETVKATRRVFRYMFYIGFALNAPLLPAYPAFVQYTNLPMGIVNAILHLNLTMAWGMQAISLHHFCTVFNIDSDDTNSECSYTTKKQL